MTSSARKLDRPREDQRTDRLLVGVVGLSWPPETFVERLLAGLSASGVDIAVSGVTVPPLSWLEERRFGWFRPPWMSMGSQARSIVRGKGALDVLRLVRSDGTDIADVDVLYVPWINHAFGYPDIFDLGVPVVVSCRGAFINVAPWNPERRSIRDGLRRVFERSAAVHCVSDAILEESIALGLNPDTAMVIRPAVDVDIFRPSQRLWSPGPIEVAAVGSLYWRKDYEHALLAVNGASRAGANVRLRLAGDGEERDRLLYTIADLDLEDRVQLLGSRDSSQVRDLLGESEIFLHASCSEGIANSVLEAMAMGLVVISTDSGGMGEALRDGQDGLLVPVRDTPRMTEALVRLAKDPELRRRMGESARERVLSEFRLDQQIASFKGLFEAVVRR